MRGVDVELTFGTSSDDADGEPSAGGGGARGDADRRRGALRGEKRCVHRPECRGEAWCTLAWRFREVLPPLS